MFYLGLTSSIAQYTPPPAATKKDRNGAKREVQGNHNARATSNIQALAGSSNEAGGQEGDKSSSGNSLLSNSGASPADNKTSKTREMLTIKDMEAKLLANQGMVVGRDIDSYNVYLPKTGGFLHTLEAGKENSQQMLMIHGYGACSAFWWKVIAQLKQYYHIYAIDQYGTGQSSRPPFTAQTFEETESFFLDPIEEFVSVMKLKNFILVGHSFGGYTSARFVISKQPDLKALYLVSPAGFTYRTPREVGDYVKQKFGRNELFAQAARGVFHMIDNLRFIPMQLMNFIGRKNLLSGFYGGLRLRNNKQEARVIAELYYLITELKNSGDKALGEFLCFGQYSKRPLVKDLTKLENEGKLPDMKVYFGASDWIDSNNAQKRLKDLEGKFDIEILRNCGHQIIFQEPVHLAEKIATDQGIDFKEVKTVNLLDSDDNIDLSLE